MARRTPEPDPGSAGEKVAAGQTAVPPSLPIQALGIDQTNDREYAPGFKGDVYIWDVDKTYLDTPIDSVKGLIKTAFEFAVDKRAFPGTAQVLRELRRGPGSRPAQAPLYFVSASPPTLRGVLERKMLLDGVELDGLTLKNPVRSVRRAGFKALKRQVPYKLGALLLYRSQLPRGAKETLFGDDMESDAIIYSLYADVVAGRLRGEDLTRILIKHKADDETAQAIADFADTLPKRSTVQRIYIHLARAKPAHLDLPSFGSWLTPVENSFQTALVLWRDGKISGKGTMRVARAIRAEGMSDLELVATLVTGIRRKLYGGPELGELVARMTAEGYLPRELTLAPTRRVARPRAPASSRFRTPEALRTG